MVQLTTQADVAAAAVFPLPGKRVLVAGQRGMVGRAVARRIGELGGEAIADHAERLDLRRQDDVADWIAQERADAIVIAAARAGGILANDTSPVDFLENNLLIQTNLVGAAHRTGFAWLLFRDAAASTLAWPSSRSPRIRC